MKGEISEIILTVGILIATSITLFLLRPLIFKQSEISQDQVISEFSTDIETTINRAIAATNDVSFTYKPLPQKYIFTVSNNIVIIQDKITGKSISFSKEGNAINNVCFEDVQKIYVKKIDQKIDIKPDSNIGCGGIPLSAITSTTIASTCQEKIISCPSNIESSWIDGFNQYYDLIREAVIEENLEKYTGSIDDAIYLVAGIITQESGWDQESGCSPTNGCGIMQITEETANGSCNTDELGGFEGIKNDIIKNIRCGIRVLKNKMSYMQSLNNYDSENLIKLSLAAYNKGQGTIEVTINSAGSSRWSDIAQIQYIAEGTRRYGICNDPSKYKIRCGHVSDCYECSAAIVIYYVDIVSNYYSSWKQCQKQSTCQTTTTTIIDASQWPPEKAFDIVFVPLGFREDEFGLFREKAEFIYNDFLKKSPFKECSDGKQRVNMYLLNPNNCELSECTNYCNDCITNARNCVINTDYGRIYDRVLAINKGMNFEPSGCPDSSVVIGCRNGDGMSIDYRCQEYGVHELGHSFGLKHIDVCGLKEAESCGLLCRPNDIPYNPVSGKYECVGPNANDCFEPDRLSFIMDYCDPFDKFGPSGYNFIKSDTTQGLSNWLTGCSSITSIIPREIIGKSVQGRDIVAFKLGDGNKKLLIVGGIHGGYEDNGIEISEMILNYFSNKLSEIPSKITLYIIPNMNPDGFELEKYPGTRGRFNANNVDLNRNWDCRWQPTSKWQDKTVSAGLSSFSEPETRSVRDFILNNGVSGVLFYHSAAGTVFNGDCGDGIKSYKLAEEIEKTSGYTHVSGGGWYEVTGDAVDYLDKIGIPAVEIELTNHEDTEWDKNYNAIITFMKVFDENVI